MVPDAEAVTLMAEILDAVKVGSYQIKLNHRKLLDGIFAVCGVPEEKFRPICSAVDKLDKTPWDEVRKEMVEIKGLAPEVADKIWTFVQLKGAPKELLNRLVSEKLLDSNPLAVKALEELNILFEYLEIFGSLDKVIFDLSLARGLDYYTGLIYEAVLNGEHGVGSIAAGGRYDNLIGIFGSPIPAVGISIGIERIFAIMEAKAKKNKEPQRESETEIFVASIDKGLLKDRMKICAELWKAGIKAEFLHKNNPKIQQQLNYANTSFIPFAIIFGKQELDEKTVKLKNMKTSEQETVKRDELVQVIKKKLEIYYSSTQ